MSRKAFAVLLSVTTLYLLVPSGSKAGQARQLARIGILIPESGRAETQSVKGLRDALKELGYKEGANILVEMRDAKGDRGALKPMADDLVGKKVHLIFTTGTRATQTAKAVTSEIPIVFRHSADPVALGLVKSMTRPGGNITGVAGFALQMTEKRLEILKQILPGVRRVHIFYDSNDKFSRENFAFARKSAEKLGLEVVERGVKSSAELKKSLASLQKEEGDAFFHVADDLVEGEADFIFDTARQKKLPTMFNEELWAIKGALSSYGPSYYQMGRQAAGLVDKILKGQKPENLPVEPAKKFDLAINLRTANVLGLTIPPEVLKKADRVIR
ncbi:MAG TPA: ABC transporter substrate-binding protein [Candidatus Binatia bacterium]|jgi:putative ABC transport system substrate-binding protein|nr:ABC transporter substrate-binding protein [Candidatus Binatia bacterium]